MLLLAATSACPGTDKPVDPALGIPLFLKIISYDEVLNPKNTDIINVHLVYNRSNAASYEQLLKSEEYFDKNREIHVNEIEVKFIPVNFTFMDSMFAEWDDSVYNVVIFTALERAQIKSVIDKKNSYNFHSFSFDPEHLQLGVAVGVDPTKKSRVITINLGESQREGSRFSAHLLKLCEIYNEAK